MDIVLGLSKEADWEDDSDLGDGPANSEFEGGKGQGTSNGGS